jgi:hypothetical protein
VTPPESTERLVIGSSIRRRGSRFGVIYTAWLLLGLGQALGDAQAGDAGKGVFDLRVRDSITGYAVPGASVVNAESSAAARRAYRLPASANLRIELGTGTHALEIAAPLHRSLRTTAFVSLENSLPITVWLDPIRTPERPRSSDPGQTPGLATVQGYVVDRQVGAPIPRAQISLGNLRTESDDTGFFTLNRSGQSTSADALPDQDSLRVDSAGYQSYVLLNTPIVEGDSHVIVELSLGTGVEIQDDAHKLLRSTEELQLSQSAPAGEESGAPIGEPNDATVVAVPPDSIRVGYSCSCTSCSTVEVMSLETYVRRGLPREWIASWTPHSLRAGAIAYRSYGSYYVYHPLRAEYDICNTTCCQVNSTSTSSSTDSAVEYTAGILLQRGGAIFRAEYSAEDNNLGCGGSGCSNSSCTCGDGNAGSPGASWPCVAEPWDAGHVCSGHGRGMCQWGTQRSSLQGQLWNWIEDHYYNNNGSPGGLRSANMTSPLDIASFSPDATQLSAGDFFNIYISAVNYAELSHSQVMLGASIYSDATGYISDPTQDTKVTLDPGPSDVARGFNVPPDAPSGTYDLLVALWLDVDGDSMITGVDQPLVFYALPAALTIM